MGGGGGGTFSDRRAPEDLRNLVRRAETRNAEAGFGATLSEALRDLLAGFNSRDVDKVNERLTEVKEVLKNSIDGSFDQLFGGSVAKHTYVDGLSDIDSLILVDGSDLEERGPANVLDYLEQTLKGELEGAVKVSHGRMAVTVEYDDDMVIQLLPAIREQDGRVRVPSWRRDGWSEINPLAFRDALTRRNTECGGRLVPTIKLAKAINGQFPRNQQLTGYHIESLAIAAFRAYDGEKTTTAMLPVLFERARDLVLAPIRDRTGQSVHVDDYLGPQNSEARQSASHLLGRVARRMRNATAAGSISLWRALFGIDE